MSGLEPRTDALKTAPDSRPLTGPADAPMTPGPVPKTVVAPGPAFTLRILHLSELREGWPGREALWRRQRGPGRGLAQEPGGDREGMKGRIKGSEPFTTLPSTGQPTVYRKGL